MAQGRSTEILSMIKWIRTRRLSIKNSFALSAPHDRPTREHREREFFIDNLPVRVQVIIVMIGWTGRAPWVFELSVPGGLTSIFLGGGDQCAVEEHEGGEDGRRVDVGVQPADPHLMYTGTHLSRSLSFLLFLFLALSLSLSLSLSLALSLALSPSLSRRPSSRCWRTVR